MSGLVQVLVAVSFGSLIGCTQAASTAPTTVEPPPPSTLFVTDRDGNAVLRYDGTTGEFRDVFVSGLEQRVDRPSSVRVGPDGLLYVAGFGRGEVLRYDLTSRAMTGVFFQDTSILEEPVELAFHGDQLVVLGNDTQNAIVLDRSGRMVRELGYPDMRAAHDFTFGSDGLLYVATDSHPQLGSAIQVWDLTTGVLVRHFGSLDVLAAATSVAFDGEALYACDSQRDQVVRFDPATGAATVLIDGASGLLDGPLGLDFGPDGALDVLDARGLQRFDPRTGTSLSQLLDATDGHIDGARSFTFVLD